LRASGGHNNAKKLLLLVENNLPNSFMGLSKQSKKKKLLFLHQELVYTVQSVVKHFCTEDQKPANDF
jgi:predicted ATPase